ncbi:DEAD/DEAH box helicase [uncultured Draconibacterium sp.]|uniref:DEAD/DEAH box helicase n=1 Tax=uncultured Draconibacterium sp. TaxID=1573823 RepID=UPI0025FF3CEF|nr:DEAD/DEAH box helicase [uncultured Draconibacterium sp.]
MYNSNTVQKIKNIPNIGKIDIERLPQELTRIYAQIVSLRKQVVEGTINFQEGELLSALKLLSKLASNLEVILVNNPDHEQKESIAFVAATANNLIHKIGIDDEYSDLLEIDDISTYISAIILFMIGNSQSDAAEISNSIDTLKISSPSQKGLVDCILSLAKGRPLEALEINFVDDEMFIEEDFESTALNFLWREIGLGIKEASKKLVGEPTVEQRNHFDTVIGLSVSEKQLFNQRSVIAGPYRLAKLLNILKNDIFERAVIDIPAPKGIKEADWLLFLRKLSLERPLLWENHIEAIKTNFLESGVSSVMTLPTGAGKSTLAELKIASALYSGKKVIYLVPTHALEDQVNKNLKQLFQEFEPVKIEFDGEYSEFDDIESFPILVMTPERCLSLLNINQSLFESVGLVVFDEFHLIHGTDLKKDRRAIDAMYCLLSLFTEVPFADYLLISAMVENGAEISSWIQEVTGRECKLFNSTWKPTRQLHGCIVYEASKIDELQQTILSNYQSRKTKNPPVKLKREMLLELQCFFSLKNIWETKDNKDYFKSKILDHNIALNINNYWRLTSNRNEIAARLAIHFSKLGLKTLVFVDDPRITKSTCETITQNLENIKNDYDDYVESHKNIIDALALELGSSEHSYFYNHRNVGVHHGLLLPIERSLIENYFKDKNGSSVLVATATLAQGINLPAEIVIIAGDDRFDEDGGNRRRVDPHELLNAAGRAGRAGLSAQGAVILIPGGIITIDDLTISNRWWQLKKEVFSKGDQCLKIKDPLEYFLDSLQDSIQDLSIEQANVLFRFKSESLSVDDTRNLFKKSFYAFNATLSNKQELFDTQVRRFLDRRNEIDNLTDDYLWQKEIGVKTGLEPSIILELDNAIDREEFDVLSNKTIVEFIDWYFIWLSSDETYITKIFTKQNTIDQIKRATGLKPTDNNSEIVSKISILSKVLKEYVQGQSLKALNELIPNVNRADNSPYLLKARNFVTRLVPELSFSFGIISMIMIEKNKQKGVNKSVLPLDLRMLSSCIREGFDTSKKLYYKMNNNLLLRVETHKEFIRTEK